MIFERTQSYILCGIYVFFPSSKSALSSVSIIKQSNLSRGAALREIASGFSMASELHRRSPGYILLNGTLREIQPNGQQ